MADDLGEGDVLYLEGDGDEGDGAGPGVSVYTMAQARAATFAAPRWRLDARIVQTGPLVVDSVAYDRLGHAPRAAILLDDRPMRFTVVLRAGDMERECVFHQAGDPWEEPALLPIVADQIQPHAVVRLNPIDAGGRRAGATLTLESNAAAYGPRLARLLVFQDFHAHAIRTYDSTSRRSVTALRRVADRMLAIAGDLVAYLTHAPLQGPAVVYLHCLRGKERSRYGFLFLHALFRLNEVHARGAGRLTRVAAPTVEATLVQWAAQLRAEGGVRAWLNAPYPSMYNALVASLALVVGMQEGDLLAALAPHDIQPRERRRVRGFTQAEIATLCAMSHTCVCGPSPAAVLCLVCGTAAFCSAACAEASGHLASCVYIYPGPGPDEPRADPDALRFLATGFIKGTTHDVTVHLPRRGHGGAGTYVDSLQAHDTARVLDAHTVAQMRAVLDDYVARGIFVSRRAHHAQSCAQARPRGADMGSAHFVYGDYMADVDARMDTLTAHLLQIDPRLGQPPGGLTCPPAGADAWAHVDWLQ
jgi:hypothetical protein